jgi:flagellar motor switch protein FliG
MLSGLEKAQVVLSMLGENSSKILERLSDSSRRKITAILGETAETDGQTRNMILSEVLSKIDNSKANRSFGAAMISPQSFNMAPPSSSGSNQFGESGLTPASPPLQQMDSDPFGSSSSPFSETAAEPVKSNMRFTPEEASRISNRLQKEKGQIIAFFMSQLNEEERTVMTDYLPTSVTTQLEESKIDKIPLAGKIFTNLLKKLSEPENENDKNTGSNAPDKEDAFRF